MTAHRNWETLRGSLSDLIEQGHGVMKMGKVYGLTPRGMALVLKRLGLHTKGQQK
jgi:hypothetical protein